MDYFLALLIGFVLCQEMKGLSKLKGFVKISRVCDSFVDFQPLSKEKISKINEKVLSTLSLVLVTNSCFLSPTLLALANLQLMTMVIAPYRLPILAS